MRCTCRNGGHAALCSDPAHVALWERYVELMSDTQAVARVQDSVVFAPKGGEPSTP